MQLTKKQLEVMDANGHLLITGGPGSGKTSVSILKAAQIADCDLQPGQKVLFLSFARASVSRVVEAIEQEQGTNPVLKKRIDVETYHSFFWRILKAHGYLVGLPRKISILTPPMEAVALSGIRSSFRGRSLTNEQIVAKKASEKDELSRIAMQEGRVSFDLFAPYVADLVVSKRIRRLIATMYPVIIFDEFQDTNASQWLVVQELNYGRLIALADPEQRIYDWIGADPKRLDHFRQTFAPHEIDLNTENHRSSDTEILMFGNDVLRGRYRQQAYKGVAVHYFEPFHDPAMTKLVTCIYAARRRLIGKGVQNWSLAILVPTKKMTRLVSDALRKPPAGKTEVPHNAVIDMEGTILGAEVIALLLEPTADSGHFERFIDVICNFFQGMGGNEPAQGALKEAIDIRNAYQKLLVYQAEGKTIQANSIIAKMKMVYDQTRSVALTGDPDKDWQAMRRVLEVGQCKRCRKVAAEVQSLRILDRGTQLHQELSQEWRENGEYSNALSVTRRAFMKEHFSTNSRPEVGVVVMNMHKSKGKQFDEVIIFEGWPIRRKGQQTYNADRIVHFNSVNNIDEQTRQNFRVSVTRAKHQVTILTPRTDICVILPGRV